MITYHSCCKYYPEVKTLNITKNGFRAYFQSWRYFHPQFERTIRRDLTFHDDVRRRAEAILQTAKADTVFDNTSFAENASTILIGMHVRKGLATKSF
jgi:hypothetical protein